MQHKKGFTLIELLVVIAIIGLLSTLSVVALQNARLKSCAEGNTGSCAEGMTPSKARQELGDSYKEKKVEEDKSELCNKQKVNCRATCANDTFGVFEECLTRCDLRHEQCIY